MVSVAILSHLISPTNVQMGLIVITGPLAPVLLILVGVSVILVYLMIHSRIMSPEILANMSKYIEFHDESLKKRFECVAMPMALAYESYISGKISFKLDTLDLLKKHRKEIFRMTIGIKEAEFILFKLIPELLGHSKQTDEKEAGTVYNRGNDFYRWFLGPSMIYTSAIFGSEDETLEIAQHRKMNLICEKLQLHKYDAPKLLDIGCGWGSLAIYAANEFNASALGVSVAKEQIDFGINQASTLHRKGEVKLEAMDYRDIPEGKYDAVACVEMAEHVGIMKFGEFLSKVKSLMKDDALFYLQIAGLRRTWQFEDLIWGIFMGNYIFPGADASCPLNWVVGELERSGFEIRSVETVGIHYSLTIKRWYDNWIANKQKVVSKYGEWWFRLWTFFLAWSVIIAEQGSSTCYQIVAHKNTDEFDRRRFLDRKRC